MSNTKVETPEGVLKTVTSTVALYEKKTADITIKSEEDYIKATGVYSSLDGCVKRIDEVVGGFNKPHQEIRKKSLEAMNANTALFAEPRQKFVGLKSGVEKSMQDWRNKEDARIERERQEAEEKQRKAQEEADLKAKEAEEKGKPLPPPPPVPEPVQVVAPPKTVHTDDGSVTAKKEIDFEIENVLELPKKYRDLILEDAVTRGYARTIIGKYVKVEGLNFKAKGVRVFPKTTFANKKK